MSSTDLWSPYQRLTVRDQAGFEVVLANGVPHQGFPIADVPLGLYFGQIDDWYPGHTFDDVLIIGAGTGNDTAMSVRRGDRRIDAVEIDPEILALGVERNYMRPYQDPRVVRTVDDGRAFLRKTDRKYDLAILAQTGFAHPVLDDGQRPPRVVPVHARGLRGRPGSPQAGRGHGALQLLLAGLGRRPARLDAPGHVRAPDDHQALRNRDVPRGGARQRAGPRWLARGSARGGGDDDSRHPTPSRPMPGHSRTSDSPACRRRSSRRSC